MAKMQSLEEEALLSGTLALQASKSPVAKQMAEVGGKKGLVVGEDGGPCGGREDGNEPQTDGDETDDYDDQARG